MKSKNVRLGWAALAAFALLVPACKGHGEKDTNDEAAAAGAQAGDEAAEPSEGAGEEVAEAGKEVGAAVKKGAHAVAMSAEDAAVAAKVKAKLLADPEVKGLAIEVEANAGKVVLKGRADSREQKQEAGKLARGTDGVREVRNKIKVAGGG